MECNANRLCITFLLLRRLDGRWGGVSMIHIAIGNILTALFFTLSIILLAVVSTHLKERINTLEIRINDLQLRVERVERKVDAYEKQEKPDFVQQQTRPYYGSQ